MSKKVVFYDCNISFATVKKKHFIDLKSALWTGYKPPSRKKLTKDLLDKVQQKFKNLLWRK